MITKTPLFSLINISTKKELSENQLVEFIKNQHFNSDFSQQIFCFFTELPIGSIIEFLKNYNISKQNLKCYYEKYIINNERNYELEDILLDV